MAFALVFHNAVANRGRRGALSPEELAEAARLRRLRMSWAAVARALGRAEPDVRAACDPAAAGEGGR